MARGRPKAQLHLSTEERAQLQGVASSRALPHGLVRRVQIVLASADGEPNSAIAQRMGLTHATVGKWRQRYLEHGIEGLHDELRAGRPRSFEDERVADVINRALQTRPPSGTHWSVRRLAADTGVSKSTVQRWFQLFGVQPHRQKTLQAVQRSLLRREGPRHRRPVPEPAGPRARAVRRREEPDPGPGTHPAGAADGPRLRRRRDPRLPAPRHHHAVRRPRHGQRHGHQRSASRAIATRSSWPSCDTSTATCRPSSTCT